LSCMSPRLIASIVKNCIMAEMNPVVMPSTGLSNRPVRPRALRVVKNERAAIIVASHIADSQSNLPSPLVDPRARKTILTFHLRTANSIGVNVTAPPEP